ncbi:hypothetical protein STEG23_038217 [Scotinomys teguina]
MRNCQKISLDPVAAVDAVAAVVAAVDAVAAVVAAVAAVAAVVAAVDAVAAVVAAVDAVAAVVAVASSLGAAADLGHEDCRPVKEETMFRGPAPASYSSYLFLSFVFWTLQ